MNRAVLGCLVTDIARPDDLCYISRCQLLISFKDVQDLLLIFTNSLLLGLSVHAFTHTRRKESRRYRGHLVAGNYLIIKIITYRRDFFNFIDSKKSITLK